jgi:histidyl-tRNA synthetase
MSVIHSSYVTDSFTFVITGTLLAGGRYDKLIKEMSGNDAPAIGILCTQYKLFHARKIASKLICLILSFALDYISLYRLGCWIRETGARN